MKTKLTLAALAMAGLGLASTSASAALLTCGQFTAGPASDCFPDEAIDVGQNEDPDLIGSAFGGDWFYLDKDEDNAGNPAPSGINEDDFFLTDDGLNPVDYGDDLSGYFFIADSVIAMYESLVFTMKGGPSDPRWAAFLLILEELMPSTDFAGYSYGEWSTSSNALSHASLYASDTPSEVPEPGTLALLGAGLVGFGIARKKRTA